MNPWVKKLVRLLNSIPLEEREAFWEELSRLVNAQGADALLTLKEACGLLRCHRTTLHRAIQQGEFREGHHFFRRGRRILFHKERLLAHIESRFPRAARTRRGTSRRASRPSPR